LSGRNAGWGRDARARCPRSRKLHVRVTPQIGPLPSPVHPHPFPAALAFLAGGRPSTRRASLNERNRLRRARFARAWARVQPSGPVDTDSRRRAATPHRDRGPDPRRHGSKVERGSRWNDGLGGREACGTKTTHYMCFPAMRRHTSRPTCLRLTCKTRP